MMNLELDSPKAAKYSAFWRTVQDGTNENLKVWQEALNNLEQSENASYSTSLTLYVPDGLFIYSFSYLPVNSLLNRGVVGSWLITISGVDELSDYYKKASYVAAGQTIQQLLFLAHENGGLIDYKKQGYLKTKRVRRHRLETFYTIKSIK